MSELLNWKGSVLNTSETFFLERAVQKLKTIKNNFRKKIISLSRFGSIYKQYLARLQNFSIKVEFVEEFIFTQTNKSFFTFWKISIVVHWKHKENKFSQLTLSIMLTANRINFIHIK